VRATVHRVTGVPTALWIVLAVASLGLATAAARALDDTPSSECTVVEGGITRGPTGARRIALLFTAHEFAEGGETILDTLRQRHAPAAFFVTGHFLDQPGFAPLVRRLLHEGHYLGPHSDAHLLYCPWEGPKRTLVTREAFAADLEANLEKIVRFGVARARITHWVPPYEWYNREIVEWGSALGLTLVNLTPGTRAAADYTGEADPRFVSSQAILDSVLDREQKDPHGLSGALLLMHMGAGPGRADKMHHRLGELLDALAARGYAFVRVDEMVPAGRCQAP
jgi:peptidoglycan/xylan/chitin deacetylase (PgdA/CDA1 family)